MNQYAKIGWLSLVFVYTVEILGIGWFGLRPNVDLLMVSVLVLLPCVHACAKWIAKDFTLLGLTGGYEVGMKYAICLLSWLTLAVSGSSFFESAVGMYAAFCLLFLLDSRITFLVALLFLFFAPVFLLLGKQALAMNTAIYTFYLFSIGIVTQMLEYALPPKKSDILARKHKKPLWLRVFLRELSVYFETTNLLLGIWIFVRIFLSPFKWMPMAGIDIYLFIYLIGYIYNASYKNGPTIFETEKSFDRWTLLFIVGVNIGAYFLFADFLLANGVRTYSLPILICALLVLNETVFFLGTDLFRKRLSR